MTTVNYQVGANNDDATEQQNDTGFDAGQNTTGADSNTVIADRSISGHRFTSVTVPKGAQIITATIQLKPVNATLDDANIDIHAEDVDNAVDFATTPDVWNRARTAASVAWVADSLGTSYVTSPELKTVIQEIVDRGSWASGNALVILLKGKSDVNKQLRPIAFEATDSVKLDIEYATVRKRSYARSII